MRKADPVQLKQLEDQAVETLIKVTHWFKDQGVKLRHEGGTVDVARIGHWVWCEGEAIKDSAALRGSLKGMGFKYSPTRKAFGWSPYKYRGKRSPLELDQLAQKYGFELGR